MVWTPFLSDSVYLLTETVFSFLPFILICVFFEWFPFFQERVTLYFPRCFFFFIILILDGLPGRIFFFGVVPGGVCWGSGVRDGEETVEVPGFPVGSAGVTGDTVESAGRSAGVVGEGGGRISPEAKPS